MSLKGHTWPSGVVRARRGPQDRRVTASTLMHAARVRVAIDPTLAAALPLAA
jgi:hypothetical protein